jgi:glutathione S-transferase
MSDYQLYCFGESGNAYKTALMLEFTGQKWKPMLVDFFNGETRSPEFRTKVNAMGEIPVLIHGDKKLTQSGVILDYLAEQTRKFSPKSEDERREILRWTLFDNHKFTGYIATLRYMIALAKTGETPVTEFLRGRTLNSLKILNEHLGGQDFLIGKRMTIADLSLCGYLFYGDELPFSLSDYAKVMNWLDRIKGVPGWKHPYDLMPRKAKIT